VTVEIYFLNKIELILIFINIKMNIFIIPETELDIQNVNNLFNNNIEMYKEGLELWYGLYHTDVTKNYELMKKYYLIGINKQIHSKSDYYCINNLGNYYQYVEINYDLMKKYYLMNIEAGILSSMFNLGNYYQDVEINYDLMKKYYLMAIDKGHLYSMYNLGNYYHLVEINYYLMKKYYLMAIDKGHLSSMYNLGKYYQTIEINYDLMKKYYLMAIDKGHLSSMYNLGKYYQDVEINYDLMKKYYLMGIDKGDLDSMSNLCNYYKNNKMLDNLLNLYIDNHIYTQAFYNDVYKYVLNSTITCETIIKLCQLDENVVIKLPKIIQYYNKVYNSKINLLKLHFEYSLTGEGFSKAKLDFISRIT